MFDSFEQKTGWWLAGILLTTAALYARTLGYGYLPGFDDELYLISRPEVVDWWGATWRQRLLTPETGYSVAFPTAIYAAVRSSFPEHFPQVLHGVNLAVHLLNVGVVFLLARRWFAPTMTVAATAIWALHPVNVETVAWLTNLKGLLFGLGVLSSLWLWERYLDRSEYRWRDRLIYGGLLTATFLVALGSRPDAIVIPALLGAVTLYRERGGWEWAGLAAMQSVWILLYLPRAIANQDAVVDLVGQSGSATLWQTYVRITRSLEVHARGILWPFDLDPAYYLTSKETLPGTIPGVVIGLGLLAIGLGLLRQGARKPLFLYGLAALLYAPYAQVVRLPQLASDSYLYIPSFAVLSLVAVLVGRYAERREIDWLRRRTVAGGLTVGLCIVFALQTHLQVDRWRNLRTLWQPVLVEQPRVWRPYNHLGRYFLERGQLEKSAAILDRGMEVFRLSRFYPDYMPMVYDRVGRPRKAYRLALESLRKGRFEYDFTYQVLLGVLARNDFPPPEGGEEDLLARAVEVYQTHESWMDQRGQRLSIASYLVRHQRPELAAPFLRREFAADQPHCIAWRLGSELPGGEDLHSPPVPARCQ